MSHCWESGETNKSSDELAHLHGQSLIFFSSYVYSLRYDCRRSSKFDLLERISGRSSLYYNFNVAKDIVVSSTLCVYIYNTSFSTTFFSISHF
jgi:hypothetical protein